MSPTDALMNMFDLTERQAAIFAFIVAHVAVKGYGPSIRGIGERFGIASPNGVVSRLRPLQAKGAIDWEPGKARTLRPRVTVVR